MSLKNEKMDFEKMRSIFFFSLVIILGIIVLYLFRPFFLSIFWAGLIAVIFYPIYKLVVKHLKWRGISSFITIILVIITIFLPLTVLFLLTINESVGLYQNVAAGSFMGRVQDAAGWLSTSQFNAYLEPLRENWSENATKIAQNISVFLFNNLKAITQNSIKFVFQLFIMFYTLFFFFKDGPRMLHRLMHLSPLGDKYEEMLYARTTSTIRATLKGTFIVGAVQGSLGGILFAITGIQGALIWAIIMTAASIIPSLGSSIIWLPTGIIMLLMGNIWQGLLIIIVGLLIISTIDNFLRPILVGRDIQMHPLIVLFSTLGGIFIFGISGFVIGPVISALFLSVMSIYEHYYQNQLNKN